MPAMAVYPCPPTPCSRLPPSLANTCARSIAKRRFTGAPAGGARFDGARALTRPTGVSAMTTYPLYLITRNPAVMSIKDFGANDKIAVPSIKISTQAIMLQMAASKAFGDKDFSRLDPLTVSLSHPDAMVALMNNTGGVNAHFGTSPFSEQEMKFPGARLLTTSYEILGGRASALVVGSLTSSSRRPQTPSGTP